MRTSHSDHRWVTLGGLCLSMAIIGIDNTILNVALPTLVRELGASTSALQWIVDSYVLVFAGMLLAAGSLGDRYGRRRALDFGLIVFGVGSVLSALSGSAAELIASRALMGFGAAFVMPSTLSILTNVFTDPGERGRAIGVWAGVSGVGIAVGPLAGGWLLEHFWWGSVFLVNLPVIALALLLDRLIVPESSDPQQPPLDLVGAGLSIVGLVALVWTLIEAPNHGWLSGTTLTGLAVAFTVLSAFATWEAHVEHPMLDVSFFRRRRFTGGSAAITISFFTLFGSLFLFTQVLQFVLGYSALKAGAALLPIAGVLLVVAPAGAALVERIGSKAVVSAGMAIIGAGLIFGARLTIDSSYLEVCVAMVFMALGMGLVMPPATEAVMGSLPMEKAGVGSAVNDTTREVGGALGVAVLGSIASSVYSSSVADSLRDAPLPAAARHAVEGSLGGAMQVAASVGGDAGAALAGVAKAGFMDAVGIAMLVAGGVALLGAFLVAWLLPARGEPLTVEEPAPELEPT